MKSGERGSKGVGGRGRGKWSASRKWGRRKGPIEMDGEDKGFSLRLVRRSQGPFRG